MLEDCPGCPRRHRMQQKLDGNSMFVTVDQTGSMAGNNNAAHPKHKQIKFADQKEGERMDQYKFGTVQSGSQGTLVPICTRTGGIEKSANPYGKVIAGSVITSSGDGKGETSLGTFVPKHILDKSMLPKNIKKNGKKAGQRVYLNGEGAEQEELNAQLDDLIGEDAVVMPEHLDPDTIFDMSEATGAALADQARRAGDHTEQAMMDSGRRRAAAAAAVAAPLAAPTEPPKTVILKGSFGKSRGKYAHVCIDNEFVVLIYDLEASVYTPPESDEVFTLSCENEDYAVSFVGIEFELSFMNSGVQVMVRKG